MSVVPAEALPGGARAGTRRPAAAAAELAPRARLWPALVAVYRAQLSRARVARIPLLFVATFQSVGIMVLMRGVVDGGDAGAGRGGRLQRARRRLRRAEPARPVLRAAAGRAAGSTTTRRCRCRRPPWCWARPARTPRSPCPGRVVTAVVRRCALRAAAGPSVGAGRRDPARRAPRWPASARPSGCSPRGRSWPRVLRAARHVGGAAAGRAAGRTGCRRRCGCARDLLPSTYGVEAFARSLRAAPRLGVRARRPRRVRGRRRRLAGRRDLGVPPGRRPVTRRTGAPGTMSV